MPAGRATSIKGAPEHPITAGFLCGKVSNYLERVYSEERRAASARARRRQGRGALPRRSAGTRRSTSPPRACATRDRAPRRRVDRALQLPRHPGHPAGRRHGQPAVRRARRLDARAHDLRERRASRARWRRNGASPEVDPEEWVHARTIVVWGWNPLSTAPHLWRFILEARRRGARLIVDRSRSAAAPRASPTGTCGRCPARDAALALGVMRALLDAGLADEEWCRGARARLRRARRAPRRTRPVELQAAALRRPGRRSARARARAGAGSAVADPPRRRRAAARRRADRLPHDRLHPGARGLVAAPRRRPRRTSRRACSACSTRRGSRGRSCAQGTARSLNMSRIGEALTDPGARPAGGRADRLELEPGRDRARSGAGARGPAPRRPLHDRVRAVHDRHGRARRRRLPGDDAARAPRRRVVVGPPLHHAQRAGDRPARRGALQQRDLPPARAPARPHRPVLRRERRGDARERCSRATRPASAWPACASAATRRSTAARARRRTPRAASPRRPASSSCAASGCADAGFDPLPFYDPPCEVADEAARRSAIRWRC